MQTISLFGAGQMGRGALRILARQLPEARFRLFDLRAQNLAQGVAIDPARFSGEVCDLSRDALDIDGSDLVLNFAGPFYLGSDKVARAAIAAGVPYLDVCDDAEGTQTILGLDAEARAAGLPVITGGGLSPGISNWMACRLLAEDKEIDGIQVVWITREKDPGGLAVLRHMLHMAVAPCPMWRDGRIEYTVGFAPQTAAWFDVPAPFKRIEAYDTAHPEPLTLAKAFPHLSLIQCKGSLFPNWANAAFSTLGRIGFGHSDITVEIDGREVIPVEVLWKLLWRRHELSGRGDRISHTQINVIGLKGGIPAVMSSITDDADMSRGTGIGMASAALALLQRDVPAGAHGVEALSYQTGLSNFAMLCTTESAFPEGIVTRAL